MTASWTWYNSARLWAIDGSGLLLAANPFKVALVNASYTPDFEAHAVYADITNELTTANGYTVGGLAIASATLTRSSTVVKLDGDDSVWTATGAGITARRAIIYVNGTINGHVKPLLAAILLDVTPADVTASPGNTFAIVYNPAGIATLTT